MSLHPSTAAAKKALRREALAGRAARSAAEIETARAAMADQLLPHLQSCSVIAAYLPLHSEPLPAELIQHLVDRGCRVLLPLASRGLPLDWADHIGETRRGNFGILEPVGPRLGTGVIAEADAILIPALLVDRRGVRLGRGGGHYDRTLSLVRGLRHRLSQGLTRPPTHCELIAVVFDDELVDELPPEELDVPMTAVVTPTGGVQQLLG